MRRARNQAARGRALPYLRRHARVRAQGSEPSGRRGTAELIPNRGAFAARPTVDETRDVYELRRILEAGDYTRAERLMEEHLLGCERQLRLGGEPQRVDLEQALGAVSEGPPGRRQGAARRPWNLPAVGS